MPWHLIVLYSMMVGLIVLGFWIHKQYHLHQRREIHSYLCDTGFVIYGSWYYTYRDGDRCGYPAINLPKGSSPGTADLWTLKLSGVGDPIYGYGLKALRRHLLDDSAYIGMFL